MADKDRPSKGNQLESLSEYADSILPKSNIRYDLLFSNLKKDPVSHVSSIDNIEYTDFDYDYEDIVNTLVKSRLDKKRELRENEQRIEQEQKKEAEELSTGQAPDQNARPETQNPPAEVKKKAIDTKMDTPPVPPPLTEPANEKGTKPLEKPDEPEKDEISEGDFEEIEEADDAEPFEELDEDIEDLSYLCEKINRETDTVDYPGAFDITGIDPSLKKHTIEKTEEKMPEVDLDEEVFGVRKAEVYYQIDKQIYSKRASSNLGLSSVPGLKSGLMLPLLVIALCFTLPPALFPVFMFVFDRASKSTLEENVINDNSILSKIAKQKEEEAKKMRDRLEDEMRQLEEQKKLMDETINEELAKRQADIENDFNKRLEDLQNRGLSRTELDKLQKQLEEERNKARDLAATEAEKRRTEQDKLLAEKNKELAQKEEEVQKALENREFELSQITESFKDQIEAKEKEREAIVARLDKIREYNQEVKDFNQRIYQFINSGIVEFQAGNREGGVSKFLDAARYYDSRNSFVLSDEELANKMITDKFFIQSINDMVAKSKSSSLYNEEMVKTLNKFKKINEFYNSGELLYGQNKYQDASGEYKKALDEFEIIGLSFEKMDQMERLVQNSVAGGYYNQALTEMKDGQYNAAIEQLSKIVIETPRSDYINESLKNITELSGLVSTGKEKSDADSGALAVFQEAERLEKQNLYIQALEKYKDVIVTYPASRYSDPSLNSALALKEILEKKKLTDFKEALTKKFNENYSMFVSEYEKGNLKSARGYYFGALANTFNQYANNSVEDFIKAENEYIASLISTASLESDEDFALRFEEMKKELEGTYETQLTTKENEIAKLEESLKDYQDRLTDTDGAAKEELERIRADYETKLSEKSGEIDGLNNTVTELRNQLNEINPDSVSSEELAKLQKAYDEKLNEISGLNTRVTELQEKLNAIDPDTVSNEELAKLQKAYDEKLNEVSGLNTRVAELQEKLDAIEPDAVSSEELDKLQKAYDEKLTEIKELNTKITELQNMLNNIDPNAIAREEVNKLKAEYEEKLGEVEQIKAEALEQKEKYIVSLKSQLMESYKEIQELKDELEYPTVSEDKYQEIEDKLTTLQKKYASLEKDAMKNKYSQDKIREEILEEVQNDYNDKLNKEKKRLREEFARELEQIRNNRTVEDSTSTTETVEKEDRQSKLVARIIELIDKSATFQFLSTSMISEVAVNDEVTIIRYVEGKEIVVGTMKITYTSSNSLFGRGRVTSSTGGYIPKINDILKN